jgi:hypothetical protein
MYKPRFLLVVSTAALAVLTAALWIGAPAVRAAGSDHVRWDIINVDIPITTLSAGGVAFATAPNNLRIRLTQWVSHWFDQ